jgi:hypothetical protein
VKYGIVVYDKGDEQVACRSVSWTFVSMIIDFYGLAVCYAGRYCNSYVFTTYGKGSFMVF